MARPKKDKELRHKHHIMLRLTDTEYEIISENAKAANLPLAEYVRKQVIKQKVITKYDHVALKVSSGRFSYLHPERNKPITGRNLGTHYEAEYLLKLFEENIKTRNVEKNPLIPEAYSVENEMPAISRPDTIQWERIRILFIKSDLRLVVDLQDCVKAKQSRAYAQKVKLSNLKEMANTVAYIQEHGFDTKDSLESTLADTKSLAASSRKALKATEEQLLNQRKEAQEKYHYYRDYQKELNTVCSNVDAILGISQSRQAAQQQNQPSQTHI